MSESYTMKTTAHLTTSQLVTLRGMLDDDLRSLRETLDALDRDQDDGTVADTEAQRALRARLQQAVAELRIALARMDEGRYGRCVTCAAAIPFERLEALPDAAACARCQDRPPAIFA